MEFTYQNLNIASIRLSRVLLDHGVQKESRGTVKFELPEPVIVHITNPVDRYINIPIRKASKVLPFAESLALAAGTNNMELYSSYTPNMIQYSDDGVYQRAGYGPRIRAFSGFNADYAIDTPEERTVFSGSPTVVDQLSFVIKTLQKDLYSQQAVVTISDPGKDCFKGGELISTKDMPCCRTIQFMVVNGKLDCTMFIRSNDFIYGFQAVNVFNWTFMQEYVANILKVPVGTYHHIANSFHYYEDKKQLVSDMAELDEFKYLSPFTWSGYPAAILSLNHFDENIKRLFRNERLLRKGEQANDIPFTISFFYDWFKVFKQHWTKEPQTFNNPYLTKLFEKKK